MRALTILTILAAFTIAAPTANATPLDQHRGSVTVNIQPAHGAPFGFRVPFGHPFDHPFRGFACGPWCFPPAIAVVPPVAAFPVAVAAPYAVPVPVAQPYPVAVPQPVAVPAPAYVPPALPVAAPSNCGCP